MGSSRACRQLILRTVLTIIFCVPLLFPSMPSADAAFLPSNVAFQSVSSDAESGIQEYRLKSNGLTVLLAEKHSSPVVTSMLVYKVGSRNEAVGYTGSTHFLEHMMFKGTLAHDPLKGTGLDDVLKPVGGLNNATTFYDRTYYYEVVPSKSLEQCLELEADRMQNALLRETDRQSEMTVVRNELERNENFASSILDTQIFSTAFREHPYHHPVIGWRSDVEGVPTSRLKQFYHDFYYPNNATLILIGDFQTSRALEMVSKYFGKVKKSPKPFPKIYTVEPAQEGERRFTVQRGEELPKIMLAYHIPKAADKDTYPLEVLASVLGDQHRQSSRLYKRLVDSGMASQAYAYNYSLRDPGLFTVYASANEGTALDKIEKTVKEELKQLADNTVSDTELDRAKKAVWKKMKLEAADPIGMAQQLAESVAVADWHWWLNLEKNIKAVSKQDLQRVASKYFADSNCSVGNYLPKDKKKTVSEANAKTNSLLGVTEPELLALNPTQVTAKQAAAASSSSTPTAAAGGLAAKVKRKVLANGLTVLVMPIKGSGVVSVAGKIKAGGFCSLDDKSLLPEMVGEMLNKGTKQISKESLANQLEALGSSIDPGVENFWTEFSSDLVSEDLDRYLSLLSSVIKEPAFASDELERIKKIKESELKDAMVDTSEVSVNTLMGALYKPGCVFYQKPFEEQIQELKSISPRNLKDFHEKYFSPSNTCIAVVGDIDANRAFKSVEDAFASWTGGSAVRIDNKSCVDDAAVAVKKIIKPIPDKSSVDIIIGKPANLSIKSKDFYAAQLANAALGHDTISSRLAEIREKHGLTYGVQSYFSDTAEKNSPWLLQLTVNPENTDKALALVDRIVSDFSKNGITDAELAMEKHRLAGEYIVYRLRTPKQIAEALSKYEILDLGPQFMDDYPANLNKVTKAEANAAISKYMNIKQMVTCLSGSVPEAKKSKINRAGIK